MSDTPQSPNEPLSYEPLSADEQAAARVRLLSLRTELQELLASTANEVKPVQLDQPIGRLSRIDAIQMQKMAQAHRRRTDARLAQITAALQAVERGTYGLCRRCESAIGRERLAAKPEAPICLDCQSELEEDE